MKQIMKLSQPIFNLLINRRLNDFTVTHARDELQKSEYRFSDDNKARMYIYRQLHRLLDNGLLKVTEVGGDKIYQKTEQFEQVRFFEKAVKKRSTKNPVSVEQKKTKIHHTPNKAKVLERECNEIQANLSVVLAEVEEYRCLMERFPDTTDLLLPVFHKEKERSVHLLAQLNTRTFLLNALNSKVETVC